jgi:hypothetical protein
MPINRSCVKRAIPIMDSYFVLLVPHFLIDEIKARNKLFYPKLSVWQGLAVDQTLHFVQIAIVLLIIS